MRLPDHFDPAERGARARAFFQEGYNCCQAVLLAFADVLESNGLAGEELLKTIGSGFGGGFGRMREVCGAFSGCTVLAGFLSPAVTPGQETRTANYALVQELAADFRERKAEGPVPSERTAEYYRKRPCPEIVCNAATLVAEKMKEAAR